MDNATRLQYLEAMGIDVWLSKAAPEPNPIPKPIAEPIGINDPVSEATANAAIQSTTLPEHEPADSWEALQAEVAPCTKCELCKTRTQTVFGSGNKSADWMFIGEGPGQQEDLQGLPFVGKAGQLLTEMLRAIGLDREEVFIANIVKCRPPSNRDPKPIEIETCIPYLKRQIALAQPKIIVVLGRIAAQALLNTEEPIGKLRGKTHTLNGTPVVVVYHPAYLLRSLLDKRKAWLDLKLALRIYQSIKG
ncbi:MAG: uracil-DNA glycosylase [Methylobacter sp.]